jgi:hypothetical protein
MEMWPEGRPVPEQQFYEGYNVKFSVMAFAGKFLLSWLTVQAGKVDLINAGPKMLPQSELDTREILTHSLLVYGDTALASIPKVNGVPIVNPICGDGQPWFSASHRWRSNSQITNSNLLSTYVHPTQTGVNYAYKQMARWRGPRNLPLGGAMGVNIRRLVIPPEFRLLTSVFAKSEKDPRSANNAVNLFNELVPGGVKVHPMLSSMSDWYAITDQEDQLPQIRELAKPTIYIIPFSSEFLHSGMNMVTAYAIGMNVHSWMAAFKVSGTYTTTIADSLI